VPPGEFTTLWRQCTGGNRLALDALTPIVYSELRKLAVSFMRNERPGSTLQPTAVIHEAYLQLVQRELPDFESRARGGGNRAELQDDRPLPAQQAEELLAADEALDRLARQDERKAKVIEVKYFGGLQPRRDRGDAGAHLERTPPLNSARQAAAQSKLNSPPQMR